jgi:hypothetical protein
VIILHKIADWMYGIALPGVKTESFQPYGVHVGGALALVTGLLVRHWPDYRESAIIRSIVM